MSTTLSTAVAAAMQRLLRVAGSAAESRFADVDGEPLHCLEEGSGPPVVLLHGGTGGGANWFRLFPRLAPNFRVLAPDLPGFGLSPPRELAAPLGARAATLIAQWLDVLGIEAATVAGTSFGGVAALRLAERAPDRVARLFLLDSAGLGRYLHPALRLAALPGLGRVFLHSTRAGTAATFQRLLTHDRGALSGEVQNALIDYLHMTATLTGPSYMARVLGLFAGPAGQREVLTDRELAAIEMPATIALGEHDGFFSHDAAQHAARVMPDARFQIIHGAGHSPNWEAPDAVVAALQALIAR